jgi:hypothetical protein
LAWQDIKASTLKKAWRNPWTASTFLDDTSDEEYEGFNIAIRSSKDILAIRLNAPQANPISKLTEEDVGNWTDVDNKRLIVEEFPDVQLIQSIVNPKMPKAVEQDKKEEKPTKLHMEASFEVYFKSIESVESSRKHTAAEVMKLHITINTSYHQNMSSLKQADLRDMF